MRLKNAMNNAAANVALLLLRSVLMFVSRMVFARTLGTTYLGINGLMTNVISMLSLAELGIGTAVNFSLYKPLVEGNREKISVLMGFYKRAYQAIGLVVACCGLVLLPFLHYLVKGGEGIEHLRLIFLLYLLNSMSTYYIAYKETLINAAQKNYKLAGLNGLFTSLMIVLQTLSLLLFRNYFVYLGLQVLVGFVQRLAINRYITRMFPEINFHSKEKLPQEEKQVLVRNVRGMMFHKLGEYSVYGTDNLVISSFIHIAVTGIYSNYSMIISMANSMLSVILNGATAGFGDLFARDGQEKQYDAFLKFEFLGFWTYGWCAIGMFVLLSPVIRLFFGDGYVMETETVLLLCLNFYMMGMRIPLNILKQAAGIYYEDRYVPLAHGVLNLVLSVPLAIVLGINGVFLGTVLSGLVSQTIKPYVFYQKCFPDRGMAGYWLRHLWYFAQLITVTAVTVWLARWVNPASQVAALAVHLGICVVVPLGLLCLINRRAPEFQYYWGLALQILGKGKKA